MKIKERFAEMSKTNKLYKTKLCGSDLYNYYLMSFPEGTDIVFRDPNSTTHSCNNCKNFIRRYGNIVAIDANGEIMTMFGVTGLEEPYKTVCETLDKMLKESAIDNVFLESYEVLDKKLNYERVNKKQELFQLGISVNHKQFTQEEADKFGVVDTKKIYVFNHINVSLPKQFVDFSDKSIESILGVYRDKFSVFKRAMEEIPLDVYILVKDLIEQDSILDGTSHLHIIDDAIIFKQKYDLAKNKDNYVWDTIHGMSDGKAKYNNTVIGKLCQELASGEDLNTCCANWNKRVDPANYHKAKAPISKKQIEEAQKFVLENGYMESFDRRLATIEDIHLSEIKYIAEPTKIKPVTLFDKVKPTVSANVPKFDGVDEVTIDKFMSDILPKCTSVEAFLTNKHEGNLVTMTTTNVAESKPIFKWNNNYSWTFNGNLAGKSQIKESVKIKGGKIDGVLRFSINWAENDKTDDTDLDAHCRLPNKNEIYYGCCKYPTISPTSGFLDVDVMHPNQQKNKDVVENIAFTDLKKMPNGTYVFYVHNFANRGNKGVLAEIEFDGNIYNYEYNQCVRGTIDVAEVTLNNGKFSIKHLLPTTNNTKELWGMETNSFQNVNLVCLSPNHWGENKVGNKHYFFMLEKAKTDKDVRGFHNENLISELLTHKKVMEVLGNKSLIKPTSNQLSGLGFNSTVRDELLVKLTGSFNRVVKIKF